MTLNIYWFGPPAENPTYKKMSKELQGFLLPADIMTTFNLPLMLLSSGIPAVTETSAPIIARRAEMLYDREKMGTTISHLTKGETRDLTELLLKFQGVTSNATKKTDTDWLVQFDLSCTSAVFRLIDRELKKLKVARES